MRIQTTHEDNGKKGRDSCEQTDFFWKMDLHLKIKFQRNTTFVNKYTKIY